MRRVKKIKSAKARRKTWLTWILIIVIIAVIGVLAYLWYLMDHQNKTIDTANNQETENYQDYTTLIESAKLPSGWNESTLKDLQKAALNAYDTSALTIYENAANGDKEAIKILETSAPSVTQPETVQEYEQLFKKLDSIPEDLAKMAASDPKSLKFVLNYDASAANTDGQEVVLTENLETIPSLKAADARWGYIPFDDALFAQTGSAETALAMVFSSYLEDPAMTPALFAQFAKDYEYEGNPVRENDSIFSGAAYLYGINVSPMEGYPALITSSLEQGSVVIAGVKDGDQVDYIVIPSMDENGNWVVYDPLSSASSKTVAPDELRDQLVSAYAFF